MRKCKSKSRRQIVEDEIRYIQTTVKDRIKAGDFHTLQFPADGRMLTLGGPVGTEGVFLVLRTTTGEVTFAMDRAHLETLNQQIIDLIDMVDSEQDNRIYLMPAASEATH